MNTTNFSLNDWLNYLENRHDQEIQLGLTRIKTVAEELNLLHFNAKIITVGGTNGKGSTVAALEAIYCEAGYQVGSYTSPHLMSFNERIRINHQPISDEALCAAFSFIEYARGTVILTYFEMATLAALYYFKQTKLDVIILEVGVGGRLDATNIVDSDVAIITTVDLDHQYYLGSTIDAIGYEKAGILRANRPFIYADHSPPDSVIRTAALLKSPKIEGFFKKTNHALLIYVPSKPTRSFPLPKIHYKAAGAAILATDTLQEVLPVTLKQIETAMQQVVIAGRQELVTGTISTIFDVAHNPQAVRLLANFVDSLEWKCKVHAVFSGLKDKDLHGLIVPMQSYVDFWYPTLLSVKRAASETLLMDAFFLSHISNVTCYDDPKTAYNSALQRAKSDDLIIVYGSFYLVNAVIANHKAILNRSN